MSVKRQIVQNFKKISNLGQPNCGEMEYQRAPEVQCSSADIVHLVSSNNIIRYKKDGKYFYFKECRKRTASKDYIETILNDYFGYVCGSANKAFICEMILQDLRQQENLTKLLHINDYVEQNYQTIKIAYNGWNTGDIGLPTLYQKYTERDEKVTNFLYQYGQFFTSYVRSEMYAYQLNSHVKEGDYQIFRAALNIATKKLADELGISEMVPASWYIKLKIDDRPVKFGFVTERCNGVCPRDLPVDQKKNIIPDFQRKLLNLHIFDALCFQRDHKEENYFVTQDAEEHVNGVLAFDNDSPMTFFAMPSAEFQNCVKCSPVIRKGKFNRPFVDEEFAKNLMRLTPTKANTVLKDELSPIQRWALGQRLRQLQHALKDVRKLNKDEWNDHSIQQEIDGTYGKTYLKHYLECDEEALIQELMGF